MSNTVLVKAVVGILHRNHTLLMAERPPHKPYPGYWEFPGGKIEVNETPLAALQRELEEELGIDVVSATHWFDHVHAYPDKHVALAIWLVEDFKGEPQGKEKQTLRWVAPTAIASLPVLAGNIAIIDKITNHFKADAADT